MAGYTVDDLTQTLYKASQGYVNSRNDRTLAQEATTVRPAISADRVFTHTIPTQVPTDLTTTTFTSNRGTRKISVAAPWIALYENVPLVSIGDVADLVYRGPTDVSSMDLYGWSPPVIGTNILTNVILPKPYAETTSLYNITLRIGTTTGTILQDTQYILNRDAGTLRIYPTSNLSMSRVTPATAVFASFWRYEGATMLSRVQTTNVISSSTLDSGTVDVLPGSVTIFKDLPYSNIFPTIANPLPSQLTIRSSPGVRLLLGSYFTGGVGSTNIIQSRSADVNGYDVGNNLLLNPRGGNIGINKNTTTVSLDVSGTVRASTLQLSTDGTTVNANIGISGSGTQLDITSGGILNQRMTQGSTVFCDNLGTSRLDLTRTTGFSHIRSNNIVTITDLTGGALNSTMLIDTVNKRVRVGNFGTAAPPTATLDVSGSAIINGSVTAGSVTTTQISGPTTGGSNLILNASGGNVGIGTGTSAPGSRLDIRGGDLRIGVGEITQRYVDVYGGIRITGENPVTINSVSITHKRIEKYATSDANPNIKIFLGTDISSNNASHMIQWVSFTTSTGTEVQHIGMSHVVVYNRKIAKIANISSTGPYFIFETDNNIIVGALVAGAKVIVYIQSTMLT